MEIARMILAIGGKFPVLFHEYIYYLTFLLVTLNIIKFQTSDYQDARFDSPPEGLSANLGRMPIAQVGEESVGQSMAIYYYLAAETGLMGEGHLEAAQILAVGEHLREMMLEFRKIVPAGTAPEIEAADKWFDTGADDVSGTADSSKRSSRFLKWWMGRIENSLASTGFAVGNKLSLADIQLYYTFAETLRDNEAPEGMAQWKKEPFGDKARVDRALVNYPKISASIDNVMKNPNFMKWKEMRGPQGF